MLPLRPCRCSLNNSEPDNTFGPSAKPYNVFSLGHVNEFFHLIFFFLQKRALFSNLLAAEKSADFQGMERNCRVPS